MSLKRQFWAELLCGEEELKQAIAEVGDHAAVVRDHLASGRWNRSAATGRMQSRVTIAQG